MNLLESEDLINLLEEADFQPRAYSGRGMFGKQCVAISCENGPIKSLSEIYLAAHTLVADPNIPYDFDDVVITLGSALTDDLGRRAILYFPDIEWIEGADQTGDGGAEPSRID